MADEAKVASTPGTEQPAGAPATPAAAPTVFDLSDDAQIRLPGQKEPAKFGDWYRGLQQKITTSGRERTELAKKFEAFTAERAQEQAELKRLRTALGADQPPPKAKPLADSLKDLSYLDGRTGADVVAALEARLAQTEQGFETRDRALKFIAGKLAEALQQQQTMTQKEAAAARRAKIKETMKSLDLPDEAEELALDLYHSFEGEDLDDKYPDLLKTRWEQITGLVRSLDKRKVDTARKRFTAPKGGDARPGAGLDLSKASSKETADALWPLLQGGSET